MDARAVSHPSAEALQAFGLGKIDDSSAETILRHLETCRDCRRAVAELSSDDFLSRLRQVQGSSSTPGPNMAPDTPIGDPKASSPETRSIAPAGVPRELADNSQYEVLRELGRGGMGVVYLARNKLMDRLEALKVINNSLLDRAGVADRFLCEIRAAAKLMHANVVIAYSAVQQGELLAFAMEYVDGCNLATVVKSQGPLPIASACFYVQQAAWGLQHAFEQGMVHRDIKPHNLILARAGRKHLVKILDFGLAKATRENSTDTGLTGDGKMMGTPDYMSPEQALDAHRADIRADIYSLGCSLYFLLTGRTPFQAKSTYELAQAHMSIDPTPVHQLRPEVPATLSAVIATMLAKDPAQRYQTPLQAAQALAPFVKGKRNPAAQSPKRAAGVATSQGILTCGPVRVATMAAEPLPRRLAEKLSQRKALSCAMGGAVVLLMSALLIGAIAGATLLLRTKDGTIVLENLPPDAKVLVDGTTATLILKDDGKTIEIQVAPGKRKLQFLRDGFKFEAEEVTLAPGERCPVTARLVPAADTSNRPESTLLDATAYLPLHEGTSRKILDFTEIHGATAERVFDWCKSLPQDFVPVFLGRHADSNPPQVHAIAVKLPNPPAYFMSFTRVGIPFTKEGCRVLTGAYIPTPQGLHFMVVWVNDNVYRWEWFFPPNEFAKWNDHYRKQGSRPYLVYPPCRADRGLMGVDWIHDHQHKNWQAVVDREQVGDLVKDMRAKKQYMSNIHSYTNNDNQLRFTAVGWDNPDQRDWRFESDMTAAQYKDRLVRSKAEGFYPVAVTSFGDPAHPRYACSWLRYCKAP